jgi:predicted kinase
MVRDQQMFSDSIARTGQVALFVAGPPGAGKSSVARVVARRLRAALIDSDAVFGAVVPLLADVDPGQVREALYDGLLESVAAAAGVGTHVVVVAPYTRERRSALEWERVRQHTRAAGAEAVLAWVHAPTDVLLRRLAGRGEGRDAGKLIDPQAWLKAAQPEAPPVVAHLSVDGTLAVEAAAESLLSQLEAAFVPVADART